MLESAVDESDVAIREECLVILGAGTDTSAVAIGYTTVMLARYPEVQEKVYQEVKEVFGDSDRPVVADDLHRFKYLDAVIRETIRLGVEKMLDDFPDVIPVTAEGKSLEKLLLPVQGAFSWRLR
ncbi:Cytochrome P450 [Operophtera brumata]|uniref:Cytochrome P450 n=1 Tax=Operophtera brumata TaxID=104452 RepID=A0A0L7KU66_OPEBR|nr:Cytochrome P450 [Operophtera brumata]